MYGLFGSASALGGRCGNFKLLGIIIHKQTLQNVYRDTQFVSTSVHTINISLHGVSEMEFTGTLLHEMAHALTPFEMGHNLVWLKTCGYLMR